MAPFSVRMGQNKWGWLPDDDILMSWVSLPFRDTKWMKLLSPLLPPKHHHHNPHHHYYFLLPSPAASPPATAHAVQSGEIMQWLGPKVEEGGPRHPALSWKLMTSGDCERKRWRLWGSLATSFHLRNSDFPQSVGDFLASPPPSLHALALSVFFDAHSAAPGIRRGGSLQLKMTKPKNGSAFPRADATIVAARQTGRRADVRRFTASLFYSTWRKGNGDGVCHADEQRRIRHSLKQQGLLSAPERLLKLNPLERISWMWKNTNWKWNCSDFLFVVPEKNNLFFGKCVICSSHSSFLKYILLFFSTNTSALKVLHCPKGTLVSCASKINIRA